jgi:hypothetical protein
MDSTMCDTTCSFDDACVLTTESASSAVAVQAEEVQEEALEGVEKLIQDLAHSDNAKVNAALDALFQDLNKDKEKCDTFIFRGGCAALVHLLKDRLKKAMKKVPACDQVTKLTELPELETIGKALDVVMRLTFYTEMGRVGIATLSGVEAAVKVMQTFPKCENLQWRACGTLRNLAASGYSIGQAKAINSGGIEVLLAAVNNHLNSAILCEFACWALSNIVHGSKENTRLLISLGVAAAVAKVRTKWPGNDKVEGRTSYLTKLLVEEMNTWIDK